jgi:phage-related protein (TIGR01555 family)
VASWRQSLARTFGLAAQPGPVVATPTDAIPANPNSLGEGLGLSGNVGAFANFMSGIGTARDASFWDTWTRPRMLTDEQRRYMGRNGLIRNAVLELYPTECTREGWSVTVTDPAVEDPAALSKGIEQYEERPGIASRSTIADAMRRALQYGDAIVLLGIDDGAKDFSQPVNAESIAAIHWAKVVDRRDFTYGQIAGPESIHFGEPEWFDVQDITSILPEGMRFGDQGNYSSGATFKADVPHAMRFHRSRVLRFTAADALSVLDTLQDSLASYFTGTAGLTSSMREHSVGMWEIKNWFDTKLSSWADHARSFLDRATRSKSSVNAIIVDADKEKFSYIPRNVSGLADLINPVMVWISAAMRAPNTKLWGVSPGGFGTGESEREDFAESVRVWQARWLAAQLGRLHDLILHAADGPSPAHYVKPEFRELVFADLSPSDEIEQQDLVNKQIDALVKLVDAGFITPEEGVASIPETAQFQVKLDKAMRAKRAIEGDVAKVEPMLVGIFTSLVAGGKSPGLIVQVNTREITPDQARTAMRIADPDRFRGPAGEADLLALFPDFPPDLGPPTGPTDPLSPGALPELPGGAPDIQETDEPEPDPVALAFSNDPLPSDTAPASVIARELSEQTGHKIPTGRVSKLAKVNEDGIARIRSWSMLGGKAVHSRAEVMRELANANGMLPEPDALSE